MNRTAFKLAASSAMLAMTMVACTAQSEAMRRHAAASDNSASYRAAARQHEQAVRSLRDGNVSAAVSAAEEAVALSPRDVGYRLLLADLYMKSGRFDSARAAFTDVVELDPSNVRGGLSLALMHIAAGRPQAAVGQLDQLEGRASAADLGLAYALAGLPERAIEILEPAARAFDSTPRLRQNLALSYALAGNWARARAVASQDVDPGELAGRLQQWAAMARPDISHNARVASLIGVTPVQDPGQPLRLALRAEPEPGVDFAAAEPAAPVDPAVPVDSDWGRPAEPAPVLVAENAPAAAPVAIAPEAPVRLAGVSPAAASYYLPPRAEAPAEAESDEAPSREAIAAATLTRPQPAVIRAASVSLPRAPAFRRAPAVAPEVRRGDSPFVVQLGAFSNEANAERAWQQAEARFGLRDHVPLTTTFATNGRTLHRVSVSGFASRQDATRLCGTIRAQGGACFVRTSAGDASVRWAARYAQERNRRA